MAAATRAGQLAAALLAALLGPAAASAQTAPPGPAAMPPAAALQGLPPELLGLGGALLRGLGGAGLLGTADPDGADADPDRLGADPFGADPFGALGGLLRRAPGGAVPPTFGVPGVVAPTVGAPSIGFPFAPASPLDVPPVDPSDPQAVQRALAAQILRLGRAGAQTPAPAPFGLPDAFAPPLLPAPGAGLPPVVLPPPPAPEGSARPTGISREERRALRRAQMQQRWEEWGNRPVRRLPMAPPVGR
jgi:hypothetical protein